MKAHILSTHMKAQERAHRSEHSGEHTYEPAQPRSRGTSHKSHFVWKFTRKMPDPKPKRAVLCRNLQEKCRTRIPRPAFYMEVYKKKRTWGCHESHFVRKIYRKSAGPGFRGPHFIWKFTGKNAHGDVTRAILRSSLQET